MECKNIEQVWETEGTKQSSSPLQMEHNYPKLDGHAPEKRQQIMDTSSSIVDMRN